MLLWLAASLAIGLTLCFAATIPPSHYLLGGCDALSTAHLVGGLAGATALAALAVGVPHLRTRLTRTLAVAAAGTFTLAAVALTYPACFRDPLAGVDPFVMEIWLSQVREAMPMMRIVATRPELLPIIALPVVFGFIAALYAIWQTRGTHPLDHLGGPDRRRSRHRVLANPCVLAGRAPRRLARLLRSACAHGSPGPQRQCNCARIHYRAALSAAFVGHLRTGAAG
jgi:hypothetical protein